MPKTVEAKPKILVIVGPTASGKSELAVNLAKKYQGEVLSVDSRQVYRLLDVGTGKVKGKFRSTPRGKVYMYKGIPHYGIDIADPKRQYSVAQFQRYSKRVIADILKRGKLPIICGGTAHWVDAVVFQQKFPEVKPNSALRKNLEKLSADKLFTKLEKLDARRAAIIDRHNKRRLVRALEIIDATGEKVPRVIENSPYEASWLGIKTSPEELRKKIGERLRKRVKQGLLKEVKVLRDYGLSWQRLSNLGLEYRWCAEYLKGNLPKDDALKKLETEINKYAKRQMTWWKRNKKIEWV
jgi:tRNA dimethylallyltransferase